MANTGVKGRVTNSQTGQGIEGLTVIAVDFDPFFNEDDILGKKVTDGSGSYDITYSADKYSLWSKDRDPDIVVRVLTKSGRLLFESKESPDVQETVLTIPEIKIHPNSIDGWLVTHSTLNPENGEPVHLFKGNEIKHLVDGDTMFPAVTQAAKEATKSINLMQLFFDVNNNLITQFKSDFKPSEPPFGDCKNVSMDATLEEVLKTKTSIPVNVMVTDIPLSADDTVTEVKEFFQGTNVKTSFFKKGFAVLHSKAIIVDGVKAILMGSPLKQGYFSGSRHAIYDARHKSSLIHDVNIQIEGPAVSHIEKTFATIWKSTEQPLTLPDAVPIPEKVGNENSNVASVQILRTLPAADYKPTAAGDEDLPHGETGILEAYQRAIINAERFIYVENQYFTSPDIIDAFLFRLRDDSKSKLEIILVLNFCPDLPGYPDQQVDNVNMLKAAAEAHGHKLGVYTLWSRSKIPRDLNFSIMPIYTHSKIAIIDDKWATVGSANLDGTSMNFHEVGLLVSGTIMSRLIAKLKLEDDFFTFLFNAWWYTLFFILKEYLVFLKILLGILYLAYKLIADREETIKLIRSTIKDTLADIREGLSDLTDIPRILREVFTRTCQHALPNRDHQPARSVEMNVVIYSGIAGQPRNAAVRELRQLLWKEHLGFASLPANVLNSPGETGVLGWVKVWDEQADKYKQTMVADEIQPADDSPVILPWVAESDPKKYLKELKIRTKFLRSKTPEFQFDKCEFKDNKDGIKWPI